MKPIEVKPDARFETIMPKHDFADSYQVTVNAPNLDAMRAAQAMFEHPPAWVKNLLSVRNHLVKWFGLKTAALRMDNSASKTVGSFPLISESPEEVLLGFDDKHLNFIISLQVTALDQNNKQVKITTVVRTHNLFGRVYLATIMPFHKLISQTMLARADFISAQ